MDKAEYERESFNPSAGGDKHDVRPRCLLVERYTLKRLNQPDAPPPYSSAVSARSSPLPVAGFGGPATMSSNHQGAKPLQRSTSASSVSSGSSEERAHVPTVRPDRRPPLSRLTGILEYGQVFQRDGPES